jgi:large subunit ribosomal protein L22
MEARSIAKWVRMSPFKVRRAADLIKGKNVHDAMNILHFSPISSAVPLEKALQSAVANFMNMEDASKVNPNELFIKELRVDGGPMLKRFRPAAMGRALPVRKRTCHISIIVANEDN